MVELSGEIRFSTAETGALFTSDAILEFYSEKEAQIELESDDGDGEADLAQAEEGLGAERAADENGRRLSDDDELVDLMPLNRSSPSKQEDGERDADSQLKRIRARLAQQTVYVILRAWREDPSLWLDRDEIANRGVEYGVWEEASVAETVRRSLGRTFDFSDASTPVQKDRTGLRYQARQWAALSDLGAKLAEALSLPPPPPVPDLPLPAPDEPAPDPPRKKPGPKPKGAGGGKPGPKPKAAAAGSSSGNGVAPLISLEGAGADEAPGEGEKGEKEGKPVIVRRPTADEIVRHLRPTLRRVLYVFLLRPAERMPLSRAWEAAVALGVAEGSTEALQLILSQARRFKFDKFGLEFPFVGPVQGGYTAAEWVPGLLEAEELRRRLDDPEAITLPVVNHIQSHHEKRGKEEGKDKKEGGAGRAHKKPRVSAPGALAAGTSAPVPLPPGVLRFLGAPAGKEEAAPAGPAPAASQEGRGGWEAPPIGPPPGEAVLVRFRRPVPGAATHHVYCDAGWRFEDVLQAVRRETGVPDIAALVAADGSSSSRLPDLLLAASAGHTHTFRAVTRAELRACDEPDEAAPALVRVQRPGDPTWTRLLCRRGMGMEELLGAVRGKLRAPGVAALVDGEGGRVPGVEELLASPREAFTALTEAELWSGDLQRLLPARQPPQAPPGGSPGASASAAAAAAAHALQQQAQHAAVAAHAVAMQSHVMHTAQAAQAAQAAAQQGVPPGAAMLAMVPHEAYYPHALAAAHFAAAQAGRM
eukprot:tig00000237_g20456.t1